MNQAWIWLLSRLHEWTCVRLRAACQRQRQHHQLELQLGWENAGKN